MKLFCDSCQDEDPSTYFDINSYQWFVYIHPGKNGQPKLGTSMCDCEECRHHSRRLNPEDRNKELQLAEHLLKTMPKFHCSTCGDEHCVRVIQQKEKQ